MYDVKYVRTKINYTMCILLSCDFRPFSLDPSLQFREPCESNARTARFAKVKGRRSQRKCRSREIVNELVEIEDAISNVSAGSPFPGQNYFFYLITVVIVERLIATRDKLLREISHGRSALPKERFYTCRFYTSARCVCNFTVCTRKTMESIFAR